MLTRDGIGINSGAEGAEKSMLEMDITGFECVQKINVLNYEVFSVSPRLHVNQNRY
jgi:hypothetical protein